MLPLTAFRRRCAFVDAKNEKFTPIAADVLNAMTLSAVEDRDALVDMGDRGLEQPGQVRRGVLLRAHDRSHLPPGGGKRRNLDETAAVVEEPIPTRC